jgi:hypothetical protein
MKRRLAMVRRAVLIALIALVAIPLAAQAPAGLKTRPDGSGTLTLAPTEKGFEVTGGPGIIFDPSNTVKPIYRVKATFTQKKKSDGNVYYGLFFGGNGMDGATPEYVYFAIAQDGSFIIRHRVGDKIDEMDKSLHYAIKKPDANGKAVNTLDVQVAPTGVSYVVNGAVVDATPTRSAIAANSFTTLEKIGGIAGVRTDGPVDVQVDGWLIQSPFQLNDRGQ